MGNLISIPLQVFNAGCQSVNCCFNVTNCFTSCGGSIYSLRMVNGIYISILGAVTLLAFSLKTLGSKFRIHLTPWEVNCKMSEQPEISDCQIDAAIYRLSFVLTLFFAALSISSCFSVGVNHKFWGIKLLVLLLGIIVSIFLPNSLFDNSGYAWIARAGSIFFVAFQNMLLIDFAYDWNEKWVANAFPDDGDDHDKKYIFGLLGISFMLYLPTLFGMPYFFANYQHHLLLSSTTLFLIVLLTTLTLIRHRLSGREELRGQLLPAGFISFYSMFLLWSALDSDTYENGEDSSYKAIKLFTGAGLATLSLMYSAYSATGKVDAFVLDGSSAEYDLGQPLVSTDSQPNYDTVSEIEDYNENWKANDKRRATIFHLFMMGASMYMAMLLTDWGISEYNDSDSIRQGNIWVKMISQWLIILLYIWSLYAPAILSEREFDY